MQETIAARAFLFFNISLYYTMFYSSYFSYLSLLIDPGINFNASNPDPNIRKAVE